MLVVWLGQGVLAVRPPSGLPALDIRDTTIQTKLSASRNGYSTTYAWLGGRRASDWDEGISPMIALAW